MNILYLANIRVPTEKAHGIQIMKACEAFVRLGHEVELVVPTRKNPITEEPFQYYGLKHTFPLTRLFTPDTVKWGRVGFIFQSLWFGMVAGLYARKHGLLIYGRDEMVLTVVSWFTNKQIVWESHDGAWNRWTRHLVKRITALVVVTSPAIDFYVRHGIPRHKLLAVSNGIDVEDFAQPETREAARARLSLPLNEKIALYIGRLDGWKGTDTLLRASTLLPPNIRVALIGGEPAQVKKLSAEYPSVLFLGFRPYAELPHNQAAADVLIVPNTAKDPVSVMFTSPLKLIAHLASNRPIVASDLPSTRFIADGAALFVPPDDAQTLANGITKVLADDKFSTKLIQKAKERVTALSWTKRAESILNFLSRV